MATLSEMRKEVAKEKKAASTSATLIIVPPALISQWVSEVVKVAGDNLVVDVFDHNILEFERRSKHPVKDFDADVVLTSYQSLEKSKKGCSNNSANVLLSTHWARVVLDEMQEIRSHTSSISKNCNALIANRRWMLSGTPLFEGFSDLRGELCFLRLDPFAADSEDGFFDFAVTQHIENRSRYGLETLRVLGLLLLRRSKSMVVRETNLPLFGLRPLTVKFQPVPQDVSERAIYCFLEHLMHTILMGNSTQQLSTRQCEKARAEKRSFLRVMREGCASVHLLNGGLGCPSQIPIIDRWMQAYNRKFIEKQMSLVSGKEEQFTCDEAIRFISQADDEVNHQNDFVSNLRMGNGGGVASRNRATADKKKEKIEDMWYRITLKKSAAFINQRKQSKLWWHKALEAVTTGGLPDEDYASVSIFHASLWKARRNTPYGHGWRPKIPHEEEEYLEVIHKRMGLQWATPSALCVSNIPNAVTKNEITAALLKCVESELKKRKTRDIEGIIQVISSGPSTTGTCWKALVLLENSHLVDIVEENFKGKFGIRIKTEAQLPHVEDRAARAKERFELAETMAIIHPTEKNQAKKVQTLRHYEVAKRLRAFGEYKEGHILVTRAHQGFRLKEFHRHSLIQSLSSTIANFDQSIRAIHDEIDALKAEMDSLQTKITNEYSEKIHGLTSVEALQALQNGRSEETACPVCQESLGDNGGLIAATQCGHLSCSRCMEDWKKEKNDQKLTCMECRKPINRIITINPRKKEDEKVVVERKRNARRLVKKAAKLLKEKENGALDPRLWHALYETMELPDNADETRDRRFPAIPGDVLGHVRIASNLPVHSEPKATNSLESPSFSSKVRALLKDLPRNELSVVFTSSKTFLKHILVALEMNDIGCRGLFKGQNELESKSAINEWHKEEKVKVLVVQAGAAACGLTLTSASKLFLMEPFLKYEEEQQAYARLHRYGQKNEVSCTVYYSPVSIESRLLDWRKQSNNYTLQDEEFQFGSFDGSDTAKNGDNDYDSDDDAQGMEKDDKLTTHLLSLHS
jgi:hypothetical protein